MTVAKAIMAGATTAGTWLGTALLDGKMSAVEWVGITGVVIAVAAVYAVPYEKSQKRDSKGRFT